MWGLAGPWLRVIGIGAPGDNGVAIDPHGLQVDVTMYLAVAWVGVVGVIDVVSLAPKGRHIVE